MVKDLGFFDNDGKFDHGHSSAEAQSQPGKYLPGRSVCFLTRQDGSRLVDGWSQSER